MLRKRLVCCWDLRQRLQNQKCHTFMLNTNDEMRNAWTNVAAIDVTYISYCPTKWIASPLHFSFQKFDQFWRLSFCFRISNKHGGQNNQRRISISDWSSARLFRRWSPIHFDCVINILTTRWRLCSSRRQNQGCYINRKLVFTNGAKIMPTYHCIWGKACVLLLWWSGLAVFRSDKKAPPSLMTH